MARQLLEQVKQAEISAQKRMEQAKLEADRILDAEREKCREMEQQRADERARRMEENVSAAEKRAVEKRAMILETCQKQAQTLRDSAGERIPEAVSRVVAWTLGS